MRHLQIVCLALALLLPSSTHTHAEQAAGTVLYFKSGKEVYLLLAEHANSSRGWAGFGGGDQEGENYAQTAARKTHEETRGHFASAQILASIKGQTPLMDGTYATYFAEVPFVPIPVIEQTEIPKEADLDAYGERSAFAWIPFSAVEPYLQEDIDRKKQYPIDAKYLPAESTVPLFWPIWLTNMRKGVIEKTLPWIAE